MLIEDTVNNRQIGRRLTSWLLTKHGELNSGPLTEHNEINPVGGRRVSTRDLWITSPDHHCLMV